MASQTQSPRSLQVPDTVLSRKNAAMNATIMGEENMESQMAAPLEVPDRFSSTFWKYLPGPAIDSALTMAKLM